LLRDPRPNLHSLIVALDCPSLGEATELANKVADHADALKVGLELFVGEGPNAVRTIRSATKLPIFLDLKLHDIPETVDRAVARVCALDVSLLTVHASGGSAMLEHAVRRAEREATKLTIVAVTVLTSLDAHDLEDLGVTRDLGSQTIELARMAQRAGVTAFVCSPREVASLRQELGTKAMLITPGVRPAGNDAGDQKRTDTPEAAIRNGANAVVIGRPIRDAAEPAAAAKDIATVIHAIGG
jgi:orotidine-5'-phosphate decarboxylase